MNIVIRNFGPLHKFSYDLGKNLIVTYGDNNIGKSYAMQLVYLLLKTLIQYDNFGTGYRMSLFLQRAFRQKERDDKQDFENLVKKFHDASLKEQDVTQEIFSKACEDLADGLMTDLLQSCENTFGNFERILQKKPTLDVKFSCYNLKLNLAAKTIIGTTKKKPIYLKETNTLYHKKQDRKDRINIHVSGEDHSQPVDVLLGYRYEALRDMLVDIRREYTNVYFLPASRSGIYSGMSAFGAIMAELSKNRTYLTRKIELPGIAEPIADYYLALTSIGGSKPKSAYAAWCKDVEKKILKGEVRFDKNKDTLVYRPDGMKEELAMTEVSSMVSEVSPIVAFMKYILREPKNTNVRKTVLFIEEPEAHLHPKNQIALVEFFTQLISLNVQIVVTSHSNYVFNKLNNLVLSHDIDYQTYEPILLESLEHGSESRQLTIDDLGAQDENFVDVSQQLYEEREEIIRKMSEEES